MPYCIQGELSMRIDIGTCQIRPYGEDDAASMAAAANNRNIWRNMQDGFPHPFTLVDAQARIALTMNQVPQQTFAIAAEEQVIGGIGLELRHDVFRRSAEIGYWLGESHWGQGIATAAVRAMTKFAFEQFDLVRIDASVFEWNPASCRVLEKAGYVQEARLRKAVYKDGEIIDRLIYARLRE